MQESTGSIMTVKEAADLLRISAQTVAKMVRDGELPAARVRRRWRIQKADIEALLERNTQRPAIKRTQGKATARACNGASTTSRRA